jgi:hypothetical protein
MLWGMTSKLTRLLPPRWLGTTSSSWSLAAMANSTLIRAHLVKALLGGERCDSGEPSRGCARCLSTRARRAAGSHRKALTHNLTHQPMDGGESRGRDRTEILENSSTGIRTSPCTFACRQFVISRSAVQVRAPAPVFPRRRGEPLERTRRAHPLHDLAACCECQRTIAHYQLNRIASWPSLPPGS